jgi:hypothetical protein
VDTKNVNDRTNGVNSTDWGISGVYGTSFRERCEEWHAFEFNEPELFFAGLILSRESATAMLRYAYGQIITATRDIDTPTLQQLYVLVDQWDRVGEYDDVGAMFCAAFMELEKAIQSTREDCKPTLLTARMYLTAGQWAHFFAVRYPRSLHQNEGAR